MLFLNAHYTTTTAQTSNVRYIPGILSKFILFWDGDDIQLIIVII